MTLTGQFKRFLQSMLGSAENVIVKHRKTTLLDATIQRGNTTVSIALQSTGIQPEVCFKNVFTLKASDMVCTLHLTDEELMRFANDLNAIVELKADHARFALAASSQNHPGQQ